MWANTNRNRCTCSRTQSDVNTCQYEYQMYGTDLMVKMMIISQSTVKNSSFNSKSIECKILSPPPPMFLFLPLESTLAEITVLLYRELSTPQKNFWIQCKSSCLCINCSSLGAGSDQIFYPTFWFWCPMQHHSWICHKLETVHKSKNLFRIILKKKKNKIKA